MKNAPFEKTIGFTDQDSTHKYPHGLSDRSAYLITRSLRIAADLCIYTNDVITVKELK